MISYHFWLTGESSVRNLVVNNYNDTVRVFNVQKIWDTLYTSLVSLFFTLKGIVLTYEYKKNKMKSRININCKQLCTSVDPFRIWDDSIWYRRERIVLKRTVKFIWYIYIKDEKLKPLLISFRLHNTKLSSILISFSEGLLQNQFL